MATVPYELLVRFKPDGSIAGASVKTLTTVGGRDYESDPIPLADSTDELFQAFADRFAARAIAERDAAIAQRDNVIAERDAALAQRDNAIVERDAALAQRDNAIVERDAAIAAAITFDPRKITVDAFLERLSKQELLWLFSDDDEGVAKIAAMLKQWAAKPWPIEMDSEQFVGAMDYLQSIEKLTAARVAEITVDASRSESPA